MSSPRPRPEPSPRMIVRLYSALRALQALRHDFDQRPPGAALAPAEALAFKVALARAARALARDTRFPLPAEVPAHRAGALAALDAALAAVTIVETAWCVRLGAD